MTAKELIDQAVKQAVKQTVAELKREGMIRENRLNSFQKTEKILFLYPQMKRTVSKYDFDGLKITNDFVKLIDEALAEISHDPYYDIIPMKYFDGKTHEQIAEHFDVQPAAISKQRKRLINQLRGVIFSDDFIKELFDGYENV